MNYKKIIWGIGIVSLFTITSCDKIKDFKGLKPQLQFLLLY